eukprot:CAMPEP_0172485578 /NCGR_PEP_ID=MMETSP1066-20121228/13658_1 /TAXON_ID=671091 /ORGANISM="Coscinodiscus wailesii, Strain CCMP2513" /LENGTH=69 /DNA_ID=CAMNT_0013250913 /DNA_START=290 /DNA_END=496 /DNA_ORIENTATION=+
MISNKKNLRQESSSSSQQNCTICRNTLGTLSNAGQQPSPSPNATTNAARLGVSPSNGANAPVNNCHRTI